MHRRKSSRRSHRRFFAEPLEGRVLLSGLAITYSASSTDLSGMATLSYNGVQLINNSLSNKQFQINRYYTLNSDGSTYTATYAGTGYTASWNTSTDTLTYTYSWGTVTCQYVQVSDTRLNMSFTVNNSASSGVTLGGVDIYPAAVTFPNAITPSNQTQIIHNPSPPTAAHYSTTTFGVDGPAIIPADYGSGVMAIVNDSPATRSMYTSLWTYNDVETNHDYFLWAGTAPKDSMLPPPQYSTTPLIYTNTAPGHSDTFEISLRFGAAGTNPMNLATDITAAYATAYPDTVAASWADRRPIGELNLTSPPTYSYNPEGWLANANKDYNSNQTALNSFGADLLSWANGSLSVLKADNAQGMIVWDIEGQHWPQATTYIGDASLATALPSSDFGYTSSGAANDIQLPVTLNNGTQTTPMGYNYNGNGALVDQFFAIFRNAGLRTGITIRPTVITYDGTNGNPRQSSPSSLSEVYILETKIQYAYARWGCTLFYLDSNTGFDRDALAQVQHDYPNVLVIPEHSSTSVYASTAPYGQLLTYDFTGTPALASPPSPSQDVLATYPNAFAVIKPADGDGGNSGFPDYYSAIATSVGRGDIILFRAWWPDAYNTTMVNIYNQDFPTLPATPTGLSATAGNALVNLSWNPVTGTGIFDSGVYNVKRSTSLNGTYTTIAYSVFGASYSDTSVVNNTHYYYEVSAVNGRGEGSNSSKLTAPVPNAAPTVSNAANLTSSTSTTANLAVLGASAAGESTLTYTWSCVSTPPNLSQPTYSVNASNAAKNTIARFYQLGNYTFTVTITDTNGLSASSSVAVAVNAVVASLSVSPINATLAGGSLQSNSASATDQFGNPIASPSVSWSVTGGGAINPSSGVFAANQSGGIYTITASSGSAQGTTGVTVVPTVFSGSTGNDSFTLRLNPANTSQAQIVVSIAGSGTITYNIAASQYPSLTINPSAGNDSLTVDFANGNPLPAGGVSFTGGTGAIGNVLYINGIATGGMAFSIDAAKVTYTPAPSTPIAYSNLQKVEFDLLGGSNALTQAAQPTAPVTFNAGAGNNTLTVNGGSYSFATDPQTAAGNLTVNDNAAVVFTPGTAGSGFNARRLAALNLGAGATVTAQTPASLQDRTVLVLGSLSLNVSAQADLGGNDLLLHSSAANRAADLTRLFGYLQNGFNNGTWTGSGLASAAAHNDPAQLTGLGLMLNDDQSNPGGAGNPAIPTFDGQSALATDLLVKYTYYGDADLNGTVNGNDYTQIDHGFAASANGWQNGDFNYDNHIDGSDYSLIDSAFNLQAGSLAAAPASETAFTTSSAAAMTASAFQSAELIRGKRSTSQASASLQHAAVFAAGIAPASPSILTLDDLLDAWRTKNHEFR